MSSSTRILERRERRPIILEGIRQDLKHAEIATRLGVNRWVIMNDLRMMRYNRDPELRQAQEAQEEIRQKKQTVFAREKKHVEHNERFLDMTGMTLKEKSFRNMIDFYRPDLMKVLNSEDQNVAILELPKSIRRPLLHNGIITKGWLHREITPHALEYLINTR